MLSAKFHLCFLGTVTLPWRMSVFAIFENDGLLVFLGFGEVKYKQIT